MEVDIYMNLLLIFFAFPIAVIIFSIILQKLLKNPILVAAFIFAIFLIVTFAVFDANFLIATLAYTILAFITAFLVSRFCDLEDDDNCSCSDNDNSNNSCNNVDNNDDVLGINNNNCGCGRRYVRNGIRF